MSAATGYRERIEQALAAGSRFAGLHATDDGRTVRVALAAPDGPLELESTAVAEGRLPTIVDLVEAAGWDEREAADRFGLRFDGHEPLRPLVHHDLELERWTTPVRGRDPYQVAVGPTHAGVIESGHFRFHLVGERILHLDTRLFFKHRGLERAAEGSTLVDGIAFVARACAACSVTSSVAYALACEELLGLRTTPGLARARTILLELERVWSHLNDVSAICAGTGLAAGTHHFGALSEEARRLNQSLTGHRYLRGSVEVGGSTLALDADGIRKTRATLEALRRGSERGMRELVFNRSFQERLPDVGIVDSNAARRLGTVGPAARAAGVADDARVASPRLSYGGFTAAIPTRTVGDVQSRFDQRPIELEQSYGLLDALLREPLAPVAAEAGGSRQEIGVARVESPRGATLCVVERNGDRVGRLRLRTGSYANWPSVAFAAAGNMLPDFPLINKSFELCYACADR